MTKLKIFIDFEAISSPFSYDAKLSEDLPSAYSIGVFSGKKFKVKSTIINFNKINDENINEFIRLDIISKVKQMIGNKDFSINRETVEFVAWASNLEKRFLSKIFKGIAVKDMVKGVSLSLNTLTSDVFDAENYFVYLKKIMQENLDQKFIKKRGLDKADGALAALAGYLLYTKSRNIKGKYTFDFDTKNLMDEFRHYSLDDVRRMGWLYENPNEYHERKIKLIETHAKNLKIIREISNIKKTLNTIEKFDKKMTVSDLNKRLNNKLIELEKQKK